MDGIVGHNQEVNRGDILINKHEPRFKKPNQKLTNQFSEKPLKFHGKRKLRVDRVLIGSKENDNEICK